MESKHYLQIDLLKALAIIFVLVIHSYDELIKHLNQLSINVDLVSLTNAISVPTTIKISNFSFFSIISSIKVLTFWQAVPLFFIVMGITLGLSFKRHNYTNLKKIYTKFYFQNRFKRIILPYIIFFVLSLIIGLLILGVTGNNLFNFSLLNFIGYYPLKGPIYGSYFVVLVFQVILIFPLLYIFFQRSPKLALFFTVITDLIFQISGYYCMNNFFYVNLIFRMISALMIGIWISNQDLNQIKKMNGKYKIKNLLSNQKTIIILGFIGLFYLIFWYFCYTGIFVGLFQFPYLNGKFSTFGCQNIISFLYAGMIVLIFFVIFPNKSNNFILNTIGLIGKASYHIFLFQILYFLIFSFTIFSKSLLGIFAVIGDVVICVSSGILVYYLEKKIFEWLNVI